MNSSYNIQLFRKPLTKELLSIIKNIYKIKNLNNHIFNKKKLLDYNTIEQLELFYFYISDFYLPCKAKIFLENININRTVTILKQILKEFNYTLSSTEKYDKNKKYTQYRINKNKKTELISMDKYQINFD
tara:strand:+ start:818 stop:1207 length:390 start_codon:yes stop_codon:yes gene_type:complete